MTIIEHEAAIVREIFARYLEGVPPRQIALDLGARGELTSMGNPWQPHTVRDLLKSRHVTGIRVFRRQDYGDGDWPVIIDRGTWTEAQDRRAYRAAAHDNRASRFYLLRGLVMCKKCGTHMAGNRCKEPSYMCTRHNKIGPAYCTRRINAAPLEAFVCDAAVELLTSLDVTGAPRATTALSAADEAAISAEEAELAEVKDMWNHREIPTREYREMRKTLEGRIDVLRRKTIVRPTVEVLGGLVGPDARSAWEALAASGDTQRMNAVLRFLFAAVIIDEHRGTRGSFDYSRIEIEANPL